MPRNQNSIDKEFAGSPTKESGIIGENWNELRLKPEPYEDSRPRIGHFTRHLEFYKETQRALPMEAACWQLSMRSSIKGSFENASWQNLFQKHEHSFDMLADAYAKAKKEENEDEFIGKKKKKREEINRIDPHRERKVHLEGDAQGSEKHAVYVQKVTPNTQRFRGFLEPQHTPGKSKYPRSHPDACRWMVGLRGGPRVAEEWYDAKKRADAEKEEEAKNSPKK